MCELWPFDTFCVSEANMILRAVVELAKYIYLTTFAERMVRPLVFFTITIFHVQSNKQF